MSEYKLTDLAKSFIKDNRNLIENGKHDEFILKAIDKDNNYLGRDDTLSIVNVFKELGINLFDYLPVNVNDKAKILSAGGQYTTYDSFFNLIGKDELKDKFTHTMFKEDELVTVLWIDMHEFFNRILAVVEDRDGHVRIIDINCLKKV